MYIRVTDAVFPIRSFRILEGEQRDSKLNEMTDMRTFLEEPLQSPLLSLIQTAHHFYSHFLPLF